MISLLGLGAVCIILQNTSLREWGLRSYVQDGLFGTGQVLGPHRSTEISQATCRIQSIHSPLNPGFPKEHCNNLGLRKSCSVSQNIRRKRGSDVRKGLVDAVEGGVQFSSVRSLSCVRLFATPWTAAHQASLFITNSQSSLRLMSIESVMPSSHILCRPLLLLPSSGSFQMSQLFTSGGQIIGVAISVLPMNTQD